MQDKYSDAEPYRSSKHFMTEHVNGLIEENNTDNNKDQNATIGMLSFLPPAQHYTALLLPQYKQLYFPVKWIPMHLLMPLL